MKPNRFDYVAYDQTAADAQARYKKGFQDLEDSIEHGLVNGRAKALVLTKMEEAYMWIGKAIRDDQIARNGSAPLQEARGQE